MAEQVPGAAVPDTTPIQRLIRTTRRLLRSSWVITGLGLTVGLLLGTLVATTLVDLAVPVWPVLRLIALLLVVLPAGWVLVTGASIVPRTCVCPHIWWSEWRRSGADLQGSITGNDPLASPPLLWVHRAGDRGSER